MIEQLNFIELRKKYESGELKPSEVTAYCLEQLHENKHLNHMITICDETALMQAKESDKRYAEKNPRPLEGMPVTVKDLFCTKDILTTAASKILANFVPTYESGVSEKALAAGCVMLGKNNMDEFAMGATNKYSAYGPAINPWGEKDKQYVTGGSSGGSAGAVAANGCLFSIGSDTGGSVRQPASFCGLVGIRPTYGRCSRRGMIGFCSSLDQAGVFAKDVRTAAALLETIMGYDEFDATSANIEVPELSKCTSDVKNIKIGMLTDKNINDEDTKKQFHKAKQIFEKQGCIVEEIDLKYLEAAIDAYYVIAPVEAASNLARYDGIRYGVAGEGDNYYEKCKNARHNFGSEVKRRILLGTYFSSQDCYETYFRHAHNILHAIKDEFKSLFEKYDLLLSPTTPHPAFEVSANKTTVELYGEDYYTSVVNLAGCCGINVPVSVNKQNLPIGVQLIAKPFDEEMLIKGALVIEEAVNFDQFRNI